MTSVTGTGCMLSALCGVFAAVEPAPMAAALLASAFWKTCARRAEERAGGRGPGSFRTALLDAAGIEYGQLDGIILCGGFGSWMDPASAERIGLLPEGLSGRTVSIGNAAGTGACRILQSAGLAEEARQIAAAAQVVSCLSAVFSASGILSP